MTAEETQISLETARAAAIAGAETIVRRGTDIGTVRVKGAQTDMVTETDIAAGVSVARAIVARDPLARFVIEEDEVYDLASVTRGALDDPAVWVIDPLDGTTSFVHGFPCYSVAVALLIDSEPVAGAVYNVALDELFSAATGLGAFRNDARIGCTKVDALDRALLITGFPYDRGALLDRQLGILRSFLKAPVHGIRRDGSAAIDCCHVACGRADGFWEFGLKPWDMAAGVVILREAGATITSIDGEPWTPTSTGLITANPRLHPLMKNIVLSE